MGNRKNIFYSQFLQILILVYLAYPDCFIFYNWDERGDRFEKFAAKISIFTFISWNFVFWEYFDELEGKQLSNLVHNWQCPPPQSGRYGNLFSLDIWYLKTKHDIPFFTLWQLFRNINSTTSNVGYSTSWIVNSF